LQDAVNSINGKEVTVSGFIGYSWASNKDKGKIRGKDKGTQTLII
jgi:hypothetical protein